MKEQIFGILERIRGYTEQKKDLQIKQSFLDKEIKRQHSLLDEILDSHNTTSREGSEWVCIVKT